MKKVSKEELDSLRVRDYLEIPEIHFDRRDITESSPDIVTE